MEQDKKIPDQESGTQDKIVETYAEDMAKVLETDTGALVKKIIHGEEEHEAEKRNFSPESRRNKIFMATGMTLIILGLGIFLYFFSQGYIRKGVNVPEQFTPLIFNDKTTFIEISGLNKDEITQRVLNQVNSTEVKIGGIEGIYLTEEGNFIGLRRFLTLTKSNLVLTPDTSLISDNFLLGVVKGGEEYASGNREGIFILIKERSAADAFDALRAWEGKMFADVRGFLGTRIDSTNNYLLTKDFEDGIVENKNARILHDKEGKIVIMYVFADDNTVIITNSQNAAREIIERLNSREKKQ